MGWGEIISNVIFLSCLVGIPCYAALRKVPVYNTFVEGATEGFNYCIRIFPFILAMLVAIGMFRAAGGFTLIGQVLAPILSWLGIPSELLPLALTRPFSGSASNAMLADIIHQYGADSLLAKMAGTLMGSTETTFFVVAIYFGAVRVFNVRHAVWAGLIADFVGVLAAVWVCLWLFG